MKKIALLMILALGLYSCNTDDDGPSVAYEIAEITASNLPEYFEDDEEYDIEVDFELPSACHTFHGFQGNGGENKENDSIFEYYVSAMTSYDPALTTCEENDSLTRTRNLFPQDFEIQSENEYSIYRFNFLTGFDSNEDPEYMTIDVPVGEPEAENPEETETPEEDTNE